MEPFLKLSSLQILPTAMLVSGMLLPRKLTWIPEKKKYLKGVHLFQTIIFGVSMLDINGGQLF